MGGSLRNGQRCGNNCVCDDCKLNIIKIVDYFVGDFYNTFEQEGKSMRNDTTQALQQMKQTKETMRIRSMTQISFFLCADYYRGVYTNSRSGMSLYAAVFIYYACRSSDGGEKGSGKCGAVYASGTCGTSCIYRGRGTGLSAASKLRVHPRLLSGQLCNRKNHRAEHGSGDASASCGKFCGTCDCLRCRHVLLLSTL